MSIQWSEDYAIGVPEIDKQHKELFAKFDDFLGACKQAKGRDEAVKMMKFLEDYVVFHFSAEEKLQLKVKYPAYPQHKNEHEAFIAEMKQLTKKVNDEGMNITIVIKLSQKILDWLIKHIGTFDKALSRYIKDEAKVTI